MRRLVDNRGCAYVDLETHQFHRISEWMAHYYVRCKRKSHRIWTFQLCSMINPPLLPKRKHERRWWRPDKIDWVHQRNEYRLSVWFSIYCGRKILCTHSRTHTSHLFASASLTRVTWCLNLINSFKLKCSAYEMMYDKTSCDEIYDVGDCGIG